MYDIPWVKTETRLPPQEGLYLTTCKNGRLTTCLNYEDGKWKNEGGAEFDVVAWYPLPRCFESK